ncbi:hypothetical protein V6N11_066626 [Hibiscus sabdariffa]|uniref:Uncharacterized protein n=1 Tax=Hibiscus sabdariffa TaxID=183260 RepID=A0ABR1ZTK4_9ROSI
MYGDVCAVMVLSEVESGMFCREIQMRVVRIEIRSSEVESLGHQVEIEVNCKQPYIPSNKVCMEAFHVEARVYVSKRSDLH